MVTDDTEKAVFELVERYNGRSIFTFKRHKLELSTDLNEDFRIDPDEAYELLECYAEKFSIDPGTITFSAYFPEDFTEPHHPLTIGLMVESARAGRWLGK